jgi:phage tail-like protein
MQRERIAALLPQVMQRTRVTGSLLDGLLAAMEAHHAPIEDAIANLDACFDPLRAPARFVPFLAHWVNLGRWTDDARRSGTSRRHSRAPQRMLPSSGRLRLLVAAAAQLAKERGTRAGLVRFLETATGIEGFVVNEEVDAAGRPHPFHFVVRAPAAARRLRDLVQQIIEAEKPAFVTYELISEEVEGAH